MDEKNNKVVVITGAASGIGLKTTEACLNAGYTVIMIDSDKAALHKQHQIISNDAPKRCFMFLLDVSDLNAYTTVIDTVMHQFKRIDGLFNNAGIEGKQAALVDYDETIFRRVLDVNTMGVYYGLKLVLPIMVKQKQGIILNMASVVGFNAVVNQSAFIASKHAVIGLTKAAALEYGQYNIQINALAPGGILTPFMEQALKGINKDNPDAVKQMLIERNPSRRLGTPDDVAKIALSFFSGNMPYVNGETIVIDGGLSIRW